ncbi:Septin-domain-containing protein [Absidia repens]|uniref:Septin-domain-containing protein n=1 Tax=Absidia repens TaxID=90262 RepID=A0A1X2I5B0_9FUNG|nr:Septin-domain-containing protein [Absidia repens]
MSKCRKDTISFLNIIVIGKENTGKTAFVRTLCERTKELMVPDTFKESSPNVLQAPLKPTEELYSVSMQLEHERRGQQQQRTALTVVDTQGLARGFVLGHQLRYLAKYIDHQLERFLVEETKVKRNLNPPDTRIHACIYFIDTHTWDGLDDVDQLAIELLSSRVNVIPVIGKTDTLSTRQQDQLKKNFRKQVFDVHKIPLYGLVSLDEVDDDDDDEDDSADSNEGTPTLTLMNHHVGGRFRLDSPPSYNNNNNNNENDNDDSIILRNLMEILQEVVNNNTHDHDARVMIDYLKYMPFSVFGYEEDRFTGRPITIATTATKDTQQQQHQHYDDATRTTTTILGRVYPWAVVDCCDPAYCDFERLVDLLLSDHGDMLRLDTVERFYEQFRIDQLLSRRVDEMVQIKSKSNQRQGVED